MPVTTLAQARDDAAPAGAETFSRSEVGLISEASEDCARWSATRLRHYLRVRNSTEPLLRPRDNAEGKHIGTAPICSSQERGVSIVVRHLDASRLAPRPSLCGTPWPFFANGKADLSGERRNLKSHLSRPPQVKMGPLACERRPRQGLIR